MLGLTTKVNPYGRLDLPAGLALCSGTECSLQSSPDQNYAGIGCTLHAQRSPGENLRSGRWTGFNKTECGLHGAFAGQRSDLRNRARIVRGRSRTKWRLSGSKSKPGTGSPEQV